MNREEGRKLERGELENGKEYRSEIVVARKSSYEALDRTILSLSSGGLALTATLLRPETCASSIHLWILDASTIMFSVAILATLFSLASSIRDHNETYEKMNEAVKAERTSPELFRDTKWVWWTRLLNRVAFWFFLVAVLLMPVSVIIYN